MWFSRMRFVVAASGACRRTRSSHDCFVSSIAADSSPLGSIPAIFSTSSGTRWASLPMPSRPSAVASRRAGSMVSSSVLPPRRIAAPRRGRGRHRRLADTARAATHHDFLGREPLQRRRPRARTARQCPSSAPSAVGDHACDTQAVITHEQVRHEEERSEQCRGAPRDARPGSGATTPRAGRRRAPRSSPGPACGNQHLARIGLGVVPRTSPRRCACEQFGQHPVDDHRAERHVDLGVQPRDELDRLGHGHLLGRRDDVDGGDVGIREQLGQPAGLIAQWTDVDELLDRVGGSELGDDVAGCRGPRRSRCRARPDPRSTRGPPT